METKGTSGTVQCASHWRSDDQRGRCCYRVRSRSTQSYPGGTGFVCKWCTKGALRALRVQIAAADFSFACLQVELIIRRVPFGRVYAIRREIDGQCLGLIRDGNTATIVDVVPNSLAARHGLPPKVSNVAESILDCIIIITTTRARAWTISFLTGKIV